jgi:hypothetical protein
MLKRRGKATETNPGWLYYTRPYTAAAYILPTSFIYQEKYSPKNSVEKKILHPPAQERTIYTESKELVSAQIFSIIAADMWISFHSIVYIYGMCV